MLPLLFVSLLWAASPGLIKHELADVPSAAVAALRLAVTALMFSPWLRVRARDGLTLLAVAKLASIGAVQFGVMYLCYVRSFAFLHAHEVFIFTVLTPFYVVAIDGIWQRRVALRHVFAAWLSIAGALVIIPRGDGSDSVLIGFLLVQGANVCFAAGQVAYRRVRPQMTAREPQVFAWLALGGAVVTMAVAAPILPADSLPALVTLRQVLVLLFLGVVSSGLGFFVWNLGVRRVDSGTLAVFNNAKIPLGVLVSLLLFGEHADPLRLTASLLLLGAGLWVSSAARPAIR